MPKFNWSFLGKIIGPILSLLSPTIREELEKAIQGLYEKALSTDNPWDDMGIELLAGLLGVPLIPK